MNYLCEHCRKDKPNPKCRIAACLLGVPWCETTTKVDESGLLERSMCQFSVVACWWCEGQSWPSGRQVPVCGMWKGGEKQPLRHQLLEMWKVDPCSMWRSFPWRISPTELTRVCERALVLSSLSGGSALLWCKYINSDPLPPRWHSSKVELHPLTRVQLPVWTRFPESRATKRRRWVVYLYKGIGKGGPCKCMILQKRKKNSLIQSV